MSVIKGSNILITGGANGIGRLMALRLAKLGGNIILADINKENLDSVVKEIEENGERLKSMCVIYQTEKILLPLLKK